MKYARSILNRNWKSDKPYNIDSVEDVQTTDSGELSVWVYDENTKNKAALAIVMTRKLLTDVYMVIFDDTTKRGTINIVSQDGNSKWREVKNDHVNLKLCHFDDVKWLMTYMWDEVTNGKVVIVRSKKIKEYFKECVKNHSIGQETINYIHEHKDEVSCSYWEQLLQEELNIIQEEANK